ncbi:MAG: hypothetical protein H7Y60_06530 [Rhodospirillaceae bacterium]|nr:hypothetical protein [Rhodospirillales bacterium]
MNRLISLLATVAILASAPAANASMFKKPVEAPATAPVVVEQPKAAEAPATAPAPITAPVAEAQEPAVAAPFAEQPKAEPKADLPKAEPVAKTSKPATKAPAKKGAAPQPKSWSGYAIAPDTASVQFADGTRLQLAGIAGSGDAKAMSAYIFERGGLICREIKAGSNTVTCRTINGSHNLAAAAVQNKVATTLDAKYLR